MSTSTMSTSTISPKLLFEKAQRGERISLIDVRTPVEYREIHVPFAKNLPLDSLDAGQVRAAVPRAGETQSGEPLYVICRSGSRASKAIDKLQKAGFTQLVNVEGGTQAWHGDGLPVNRGKKAVSLERQVRIAAGALVFTGAVLGYFVSPYWIGLSGFVGAGLMFAGITDTCAMGMLIARMPWNQVKPAEGTACAVPAGQDNTNSPSCCG